MSVNQASLYTLASLLKQGKQLDQLSLAVMMLSIITGLLVGVVGEYTYLCFLLAAIILAVIEKYYAIRVRFDSKLFLYLAAHVDKLPEKLQELDISLTELGLIKLTNQTRSIESRQQGALALFKKQAILCGLQLMLLVIVFIGLWIVN